MPSAEEPTRMALMLRGSLITLKRKCGRPGCRCARGELHETPALSLNVAGKTRILTLRAAEIPQVKAALARYKQARAELNEQVQAGLVALQARREPGKAQPRKGVKKGAL